MRKLATVSFAFAAAILISQYLLPLRLQPVFAGAAFILALVALLLKGNMRLRMILVFSALAAGFIFNFLYVRLYFSPAETLAGRTDTVSATVMDFPQKTDYGEKAEVKVRSGNGRPVKTVMYLYGETKNLLPGDEITFTADFSLSNKVRGDETDTFTSKGYFLFAKRVADLTVTDSKGFSLPFAHKYISKYIKDRILLLFPEDTAGFVTALLTGDKDRLYDDSTLIAALRCTGIYHIVAVSGMHVSLLAGFVLLITRLRHKAVFAVVPVILLFMGISGFTPSVVRAVIMQIFILAAPLFKREYDGVTSLSAALLIILLGNPYAAAGMGLQLSFAATLGILTVSPRIMSFFRDLFGNEYGTGFIRGFVSRFILPAFSATIGAMIFTVPVIALYFGYMSLLAPIFNILILWAVAPAFCLGLTAVVIGSVFIPAGSAIAWAASLFVRYISWASKAAARFPVSYIYLDNIWLVLWLVFVYAMILLFVIMREKPRRLLTPLCFGISALIVILVLNAETSSSKGLSVTVLDVGQGQTIVATEGEYTAVVDCGSDQDGEAFTAILNYLSSRGKMKIDLLIFTHYHQDHANGALELLDLFNVAAIAGPVPQEDDLYAGEIIKTAEKNGTQIIYVTRDMKAAIGNCGIDLYAPFGSGTDNECEVAVKISEGDFDVLITGDIGFETENKLIEKEDLRDTEVLIAGHHGSKTSTSAKLLAVAKPQKVVISVGYNTYGHPSEETLKRISRTGASVYRTDIDGSVTIKAGG